MRELRTLIVNDSFVTRKIVARALRQAGMDSMDSFVVFEAANGGEGIEISRRK